MTITRRGFIRGAALAPVAAMTRATLSVAAPAAFERPLPIPTLLDPRETGNRVSLIAGKGRHAFFAGKPAPSAGYNGAILGPAIRLRSGEEINVTVENRLDSPTALHWHGLLIPSESDGGPHNHIAAGSIWKAKLEIDQPEATAWFHPHPHGDTGRQVYAGLAGMLLVEDGSSERLGLPRTYGTDDLPLILQERQFNANGAPVYMGNSAGVMFGARGDAVIANGILAPFARVPAGLVRLRLLNGANARTFDLAFSDGREFHVIASDGGLLPTPVLVKRLIVSPGERFELVVDFSNGRATVLETGADEFMPMMGMMRDDVSGPAKIMRFEPDTKLASVAKPLPAELTPKMPARTLQGLRRRRFVLNDHMGGMGGMRFGSSVMAINGRPYDIERIDIEVPLGASEVWEIESQMMPHPFHIHGVHFEVLSLDGRLPPPHLRGRKDTVLVKRSAQILVQFTQPATKTHPYMYHCHILEHEDAGMMGQYITV